MYALYFMIWWLSGIWVFIKIIKNIENEDYISRKQGLLSVLMGLFGPVINGTYYIFFLDHDPKNFWNKRLF